MEQHRDYIQVVHTDARPAQYIVAQRVAAGLKVDCKSERTLHLLEEHVAYSLGEYNFQCAVANLLLSALGLNLYRLINCMQLTIDQL